MPLGIEGKKRVLASYKYRRNNSKSLQQFPESITTQSRRGILVICGAILSSLAGCFSEPESAGDDTPATDEHLSKEEAAEYVVEYAESEWSNRDEEAFGLHQDGVSAFSDGNYSRAIRDLQLSFEIYEELSEESWEKRNEFDEEQPRRELFNLIWDLYRLMEESTASWYNAAYAIQVEDNHAAALDWVDRAEDHYDDASWAATEYNDLLNEWGEDG